LLKEPKPRVLHKSQEPPNTGYCHSTYRADAGSMPWAKQHPSFVPMVKAAKSI